MSYENLFLRPVFFIFVASKIKMIFLKVKVGSEEDSLFKVESAVLHGWYPKHIFRPWVFESR